MATVTLKDIALDTGVSPSTVSIVLKGNGDERKISSETQKKVFEAASRLGYKPNIQARILRGGISNNVIITVFWASDIRVHMLSRFMQGLQAALIEHHYPCELQIKPYINGHLSESLSERTMLGCNGIILCNPSEEDMEFLEALNSLVPIVLYNRYSKKYNTINMDDKTIGSLPAEIFIKHGKKRPAIIKAPATFNGMNIRTNVFEYKIYESGMEQSICVTVPDTMKGGYDGALKLCDMTDLPDCLFCTSDAIAIGALKAFYSKGIHIPEQIEIISIGNGNREQQEFAIPSISVINLPMEQMAAACLKKVFELLSDADLSINSIEFPITYISRESCLP